MFVLRGPRRSLFVRPRGGATGSITTAVRPRSSGAVPVAGVVSVPVPVGITPLIVAVIDSWVESVLPGISAVPFSISIVASSVVSWVLAISIVVTAVCKEPTL